MRLAATRSSISAGSAVGDCAPAGAAVMTSPRSKPKNLNTAACSPPGRHSRSILSEISQIPDLDSHMSAFFARHDDEGSYRSGALNEASKAGGERRGAADSFGISAFLTRRGAPPHGAARML